MTLKTVLHALRLVVVDHLSISSVAAIIGVTWHAANDAISELGLEVLINNPARLEGVRVIGVDEHVWRHTPRGPRFVTVIIDLTPVADKTGAARS
ncbi:Transposase and inactivated derivatives [Mobiluncus mulieris]|nr:Transposase and inactivated derivatives [Mobiluncus mulieris]